MFWDSGNSQANYETWNHQYSNIEFKVVSKDDDDDNDKDTMNYSVAKNRDNYIDDNDEDDDNNMMTESSCWVGLT